MHCSCVCSNGASWRKTGPAMVPLGFTWPHPRRLAQPPASFGFDPQEWSLRGRQVLVSALVHANAAYAARVAENCADFGLVGGISGLQVGFHYVTCEVEATVFELTSGNEYRQSGAGLGMRAVHGTVESAQYDAAQVWDRMWEPRPFGSESLHPLAGPVLGAEAKTRYNDVIMRTLKRKRSRDAPSIIPPSQRQRVEEVINELLDHHDDVFFNGFINSNNFHIEDFFF